MACYRARMQGEGPNRTYRNIRERYRVLVERQQERRNQQSARTPAPTPTSRPPSSSSSSSPPEHDPIGARVRGIKRRIDNISEDALDSVAEHLNELQEALAKRRRVLEEEAERKRKEEEEKERKEREKEANTDKCVCTLCLDECDTGVMATKCGHTMCVQCTTNLLTQPLSYYGQQYHKCPACRTDLDGVSAIIALPGGTTEGQVYKAVKESNAKRVKELADGQARARAHSELMNQRSFD